MAYRLRGETEFEKGMGLPRLTTAQRTAYTPSAEGYKVYDTDLSAEFTYNGAAWENASASGKVDKAGDTMTGELIFSGTINASIDHVDGDLAISTNQGTGAFSEVLVGTASSGVRLRSGSGTNVATLALDVQGSSSVNLGFTNQDGNQIFSYEEGVGGAIEEKFIFSKSVQVPAFVGGEAGTTATTKDYVDSEIIAASPDLSGKVNIAGDTMTGPLQIESSTAYITLKPTDLVSSPAIEFENSTPDTTAAQLRWFQGSDLLELSKQHSAAGAQTTINLRDDYIEVDKEMRNSGADITASSNIQALTTRQYVDAGLAGFVPSGVVDLTTAQTIAGNKTFTGVTELSQVVGGGIPLTVRTESSASETGIAIYTDSVTSIPMRFYNQGTQIANFNTFAGQFHIDGGSSLNNRIRLDDIGITISQGGGSGASLQMTSTKASFVGKPVTGSSAVYFQTDYVHTAGDVAGTLVRKDYVEANFAPLVGGAGGQPDYSLVTGSGIAAYTVAFTIATAGAGKTNLQVFVNGLKQILGATKSYTVSGNVVTFTAGNIPASGADVEFYGFG